MSEEFSQVSNQSIWMLLERLIAIVEVLKKELPFDYLTPQWHIEEGTDNFMATFSFGVFGCPVAKTYFSYTQIARSGKTTCFRRCCR
jgi:hypothetical protein